jgi:aryl-alcohol dehydrogenase-like predicted oxidoreductase
MKERNLGRSGLKVSTLGLGCNNLGGRLDRAASIRVVHAALDLGVTLFDTADVYAMGNRGGSEMVLGEALGARRKDIVLATKFGLPMDDARKQRGGSRRYVMNAVEASLTRLKTDWIDLYQLHVPDPETPIEETLRALDDLVTQGKVRYIGCSNFVGWQMVEANLKARQANLTPFVSCQNEYSLVVRNVDRELGDAMLAYGVGFLPYFPLASGLLTGKYRRNAAPPPGARLTVSPRLTDRFLSESNYALVEKLQDFCDARGCTLLELAFSWLLARPFVSSVIAGATSPEQLEQNAKAIERPLTAEDLAEIDRITDAASLRQFVG